MDKLRRSNIEGAKETARVEAFSDGVFAIAITLLILELIQILSPAGKRGLLQVVLTNWPSFFAFATGFLTILICWINHHLVFEYIRRTDSKLMWVNGFVLLVVTFTPFPTAMLAEYFAKEPHTALALFGANYFMMSLAAYGICAYPYKKHLIDEEDRELFNSFRRLYFYSIFYTFLVFFVCLVSVPVAIFLYCILFAVFAFPRESARRIQRPKRKARHRK